LNIVQSDGKVSGTLVNVYPDGTQHDAPITDQSISEGILHFDAVDQDVIFHWSLTLGRTKHKGILCGYEGKTVTGQRGGEMIIRFPVKWSNIP
jgi:hypothetical protein